jgi:hypothetical protein
MMGAKQARGPAPSQSQAQPGQQPDPQSEDSPGDENEGTQQASPEEQQAYEQFVRAAMNRAFPDGQDQSKDGGVAPDVMANLRGQYDQQTQQMFAKADPPLRPLEKAPIDPLAVATASLVITTEQSLQLNDPSNDLQNQIVYHGGKELMEQLAQVSAAAKVQDYDEANLETAFYRAVDLYRVASSRVDQQALAQQFGGVVQADRQGAFDSGSGQDAGTGQGG